MDTSQFVTKTDLTEAFEVFATRMEKSLATMETRIEKMVGQVVGEIVGDALHMISERFDKVDARMDAMDQRFDTLEEKVDASRDLVDHHTVDIRALQRKTA